MCQSFTCQSFTFQSFTFQSFPPTHRTGFETMNTMASSLTRQIARLRPDGRLTTYRDRYRIASLLSFVPLPLARIFALFGSDKERQGGHAYGQAYEGLLRKLRYKPVKLLEIGLLAGDSLLSWRAYFPFATTIGIDIEPKQHMAGNRTRIYQADQGSGADLTKLCQQEGPFDVILDDGSHYNHHQLFSFRHLFPHLKDGGLYIIEDVQTSFWTGRYFNMTWDGAHVADPEFPQTCYGVFLELAKYLNHMEFSTTRGTDPAMMDLGRQIVRIAFEHNIITIWKGRNDLPSNAIGPNRGAD